MSGSSVGVAPTILQASLYVLLPVRATAESRANTGEFLHRLNYHSKRKFWEMDYNDGEIRLTSFTDTVTGPLTEAHFRGILHSMVTTADVVFPYLTSVLSGRMTPDFSADQAQAALRAFWNRPRSPTAWMERCQKIESLDCLVPSTFHFPTFDDPCPPDVNQTHAGHCGESV
jgi:hypothetical protein